ncbi:unnamed protein product [Citrullus colocynthis]|uniref:Uncharacterized protein n=1 Tax=Citrullus colocynthis TaxID=252529 RepID=A0ABP0XLL7_9ROSI
MQYKLCMSYKVQAIKETDHQGESELENELAMRSDAARKPFFWLGSPYMVESSTVARDTVEGIIDKIGRKSIG